MASSLSELTKDYEHDITWLIDLYVLIHNDGRDDQRAVEVSPTSVALAGALAASLAESAGTHPLTEERLREHLEMLQIHLCKVEGCPNGYRDTVINGKCQCVPNAAILAPSGVGAGRL